MQMQVDKHAAAWAPGPADSPTPARRSTTASGACRGWGGRAQLPTRCTAQGGRQAGGRRAGGTRSKQEDRRFHTPDSRQWTESGDADKGPTVQRAGVGADFPPSRVQSTLNQACGGKGEPRVSGSVACRGARHSRDGAASRRWGGRFGEAVLGCQISGPQGRGSPESDEGPRGHGRPIWASEPPAGPPPAQSRASFGSGREVCSCGRHRRREAVWNHGGGGGGLALRGGQGRGGRAANQNQNRGRGAGGGRGRGRRPCPRSSRTSSKQSVWRGRGVGSRAAGGQCARLAPRYLVCPGQHPHRDSLHGLPLLQTRRAQLVLAHGRTGRTGPPCGRGSGLGVRPPRPRPSSGREGAAQKVSRRPGKENSALFLEKKKKKSCFFPPKIPFPSRVRVLGHVFLKMYYFLLYSCQ